jgi:hypothetical protein
MRSSIPFISRFDSSSHESDRLLGLFLIGACIALSPSEKALGFPLNTGSRIRKADGT